ncbi:hypothetical protein CRENBAI_003198 [Crenichthys baileyi]|uniref:Uncharacterized protein n=1 Tax=Crenichthys baileyi TaxID=28760 RepID=A0AAV9RGZ8_9TELE
MKGKCSSSSEREKLSGRNPAVFGWRGPDALKGLVTAPLLHPLCSSLLFWGSHYYLMITDLSPLTSLLIGMSMVMMHRCERALAALSKPSHIKAIIISPLAIISVSDSPLLTKLISPSSRVLCLTCSNVFRSPSPP